MACAFCYTGAMMKKRTGPAPLKVICISHWHCRACARTLDCSWPARLWAALETTEPGRYYVYHFVVDSHEPDAALAHLQDKVLRYLPGIVVIQPPARAAVYLRAVRQAVAARQGQYVALPANCRGTTPDLGRLAAHVTRWADRAKRGLS